MSVEQEKRLESRLHFNYFNNLQWKQCIYCLISLQFNGQGDILVYLVYIKVKKLKLLYIT